MRRITVAAAVLAVVLAGPVAAQPQDAQPQPIATAHQTEFQIGQLATIRGQSPRVRQFGQALMDEHGTALERLRQAGAVTWPIEIDAKHRKLEEELSTLSGREFDRRFLDAMVEDHEALASLLRGQGEAGAPPSAGAADRPVGTSGLTAESSAPEGAAAGAPRATGTSGTRTAGSATSTSESTTLRAVEKHLAEARRLQRALGDGR